MTNQNEQIEQAAVSLLRQHPRGLRYMQLIDRVCEALPGVRENSVRAVVYRLTNRGAEVARPRRGLYVYSPSSTPRPPRLQLVEQGYYGAFADFIARLERCRCIIVGGKKLGVGTPDVLGVCEALPGCVTPHPPLIIAGELKRDASNVEQGFGQAFGYRQWAHKSYLALPAEARSHVRRARELCLRAGIGLCVFRSATTTPEVSECRFRLILPAITGVPDLELLNAKLEAVRDELVAK